MIPGIVFAVASCRRLDGGVQAEARRQSGKEKGGIPRGLVQVGDKLLSQIPHVTV